MYPAGLPVSKRGAAWLRGNGSEALRSNWPSARKIAGACMCSGGFGMGGGRRLAGWLVHGLALVAAFSVACARGKGSDSASTSPVASDTPDGGTVTDPGGGVDAGQPDAGSPP